MKKAERIQKMKEAEEKEVKEMGTFKEELGEKRK